MFSLRLKYQISAYTATFVQWPVTKCTSALAHIQKPNYSRFHGEYDADYNVT